MVNVQFITLLNEHKETLQQWLFIPDQNIETDQTFTTINFVFEQGDIYLVHFTANNFGTLLSKQGSNDMSL